MKKTNKTLYFPTLKPNIATIKVKIEWKQGLGIQEVPLTRLIEARIY